jgi:hypothetical protein
MRRHLRSYLPNSMRTLLRLFPHQVADQEAEESAEAPEGRHGSLGRHGKGGSKIPKGDDQL